MVGLGPTIHEFLWARLRRGSQTRGWSCQAHGCPAGNLHGCFSDRLPSNLGSKRLKRTWVTGPRRFVSAEWRPKRINPARNAESNCLHFSCRTAVDLVRPSTSFDGRDRAVADKLVDGRAKHDHDDKRE